MEVIHRAATRMNRLIQDLLDVALMEAGQLTIERARLSAGELVVEAVEMQRPLASSSSLELRVDVETTFPRSGVIATGSFRCSRTSSATRSSSRRLAAGSRWARRRAITRSSSGLRIPAAASRPRTCPMSLTDFGKQPEVGVEAPGSGFPSPRASSRLTADASGSRARWDGAALSSSRSREPAR